MSPVLQGSSGWLIYSRGNDLYVGDLAAGNEDQLTNGSLGAGYAGDVVVDGEIWLYYFSITEANGVGQPSSAIMLRRRLSGGAEEQLFTFAPSRTQSLARDITAVSPDGARVAYVAGDGLHMRTLESGEDELLLQNIPMSADRSVRGIYYDRPVWSPAGPWLLAMRESEPPANAPNAGPLIVNPSAPGSERDLRLGLNSEQAWSPDGHQLCVGVGTGVGTADVGLYDVASGAVRNLTSSWFPNASLGHSLSAGVWANDGKLASEYDVASLQVGLAILDTSGSQIALLDAGAVVPGVIQWLPDSSGVIVETLEGASLDAHSSAVMLDGSWRRLPNDPGQVVGTIPAPP